MCRDNDDDHDSEERENLRLLGDWLARWRTSLGVSQRVLANRAGIDQSGLSRVERGLQACGSRRLGRLIVALDDFSGSTLMGRVQPPPVRPRRPAVDPWAETDDVPERLS
jgi:hypothetical protein